jgi:hypothetical protein
MVGDIEKVNGHQLRVAIYFKTIDTYLFAIFASAVVTAVTILTSTIWVTAFSRVFLSCFSQLKFCFHDLFFNYLISQK